jgi:nucleoside-diphosphate-sugar epimerase
MKHRKFLVTGGSGYLGRRIVAALAGEADVMVLDRHPLDGVASLACDLSDQTAVTQAVKVARPTHLIHAAWYVEHGKFWTAPENHGWVDRSLHLLRTFRESGGCYALGLGSCVEYGPQEGPLQEDRSPIAPSTLYGQCKDAFRRAAQDYAQESGLPFGWARLFFPIGLDEPPERLVASVARRLVADVEAPCTDGAGIRDFIDVRDAGAAIAALALAEKPGTHNVGSGCGVTIASVARRLGELTGRPEKVLIGALPSRRGEPASLVADVSKLAATGFAPRFTLDQTLQDALAWWRDHP